MEVMERWFKFYFEVNQVEKIDEDKTSTYVLVRWKQDMIKKNLGNHAWMISKNTSAYCFWGSATVSFNNV